MSWLRAEVLITDRFALEPLVAGDADEMVAVLAPLDLYRFTGGDPPTLEVLRARFERQSRGQSPDGSAGWLNWIIRTASHGTAIGFVQATVTREGGRLLANVAWLVSPNRQGQGVAAEAATAVVAWLRSIGVSGIRALIHPDHTASARVAERAGLAATRTRVDGEVLWETPAPADENRYVSP